MISSRPLARLHSLRQRGLAPRLGAIGVALLLYLGLFLLVSRWVGNAAIILSALPLLTSALMIGGAGATLTLVVMVPLNLALITLFSGEPIVPRNFITAHIAFAVFAGAAGYLSTLRTQLEAELGRRREVEAELRETQRALETMATTDQLTGLRNRRGFLLIAERWLALSIRLRTPAYLLFGDVDGLKTINDQLGHKLGDQAIREAGELIQRSIREADRPAVARLGGDEFVALLLTHGDSVEPNESVLERLEAGLAEINAEPNRPFSLSVSFGLVRWDPEGDASLEDLIERADQKMYVAKTSKAPGPPT